MGQPQGASGGWVQLMPFVLVLAIFYFIILLPMRRRQQHLKLRSAAIAHKGRSLAGLFYAVAGLKVSETPFMQ